MSFMHVLCMILTLIPHAHNDDNEDEAEDDDDDDGDDDDNGIDTSL